MHYWTLLLDDHTSTELAELSVVPTMRWEIGKATSVTFSLDQLADAAGELAGALANGIPRLRAYRDGVLRAHGHWRPQQDTADAEGATAQCTFRGPFARLETRHLRAVLTRTQVDQGQIIFDALAAANAIAPTGLAAGTLQASKLRDRTYEPGKQIAELIVQMTEVIDGCEVIERPVDNNPAILAALDITGELGQDRSAEVRFELGQDTLSNLQGFEREIILPINHATVSGQDGTDTEPGPAPQVASDQASINKWGLYEATLALSDVTQAGTLLERAQALIRPDPGRTVTLTPDPTQAPQPWDEWWLGDTVGYLVDEGAVVDEGTARPVALEIVLDESGNETAWKVEWGEQSPSWPDGVVAALRRRLSALER
jgi:hypothetical protein